MNRTELMEQIEGRWPGQASTTLLLDFDGEFKCTAHCARRGVPR